MSRVLPQRAKKDVSFFRALSSHLPASGHVTQPVTKIKNKKEWILKNFPNAILPQIEAGMAALYGLVKPTLIPKVRAVYKEQAEGDPVCFATVSKTFPNFMNLKSFVGSTFGAAGHETKTQETLGFLIGNGLPELLALSYFFEEDDAHCGNIGISEGHVVRIDFDMSAFSLVGQPNLRGPRTLVGSVSVYTPSFDIHNEDLTHFPKIEKATPYYWPTISRSFSSANGYTADEIKAFSTLENDKEFVHKSYLTFLKIILLPDSAIRANLAAHIQDEAVLNEMVDHFIKRKEKLKQELFRCEKFRSWWREAPVDELKNLFQDFSKSNADLKPQHQNLQVDIPEASATYHSFCRDMIKEGMEKSFFGLVEAINSCRSEFSAASKAVFEIDIYSSLKSLRDFLFESYSTFCKIAQMTERDIRLFLEEIRNTLIAFQSVRIPVVGETKNKFAHFYVKIQETLNLLERNTLTAASGDRQTEVVSVGVPSTVPLERPAPLPMPTLNLEELTREAIFWVRKPENKSMVVDLLKKACDEYEKSTVTAMGQLGSGLYSVVTSTCSWFYAKPAPDAMPKSVSTTAPSTSVDLAKFVRELEESTSSDLLCQCISRLLSETTQPWFKIVCEQFALGIVNQQVREFSAKNIVDRLRENPGFAEYLNLQPTRTVETSQANKMARLLISEMQPSSREFTTDADWIGVDHTSNRFKEGDEKEDSRTEVGLTT